MCGIFCLVQTGAKIPDHLVKSCLLKLRPRGPDKSNLISISLSNQIEISLGFTRLSVMDTTDAGLQPFVDGNIHVVCNGEIYNYQELASDDNIRMASSCDCEIILPIYRKYGFHQMLGQKLNGEFAMVLLDGLTLYAGRDRFGVRPLFFGHNKKLGIMGFASEMKALDPIMEFVEQVPPNAYARMDLGHTFSASPEFVEYLTYGVERCMPIAPLDQIHCQIRQLLTAAVKKRLQADRPIGFLLSGGLDSALITSIACRILGPDQMVCFTIGIPGSPDVSAAKTVTQFLGIKQHHVIDFSVEKGLDVLEEVIAAIESYDVTTIRASVPQYMMGQYIRTNTNIKVLLSGEGSDEIHGSYRYFRDAENPTEFHLETQRLLRDLCFFDNLRTDRTMGSNGLEVRVPFLDFDYVKYITELDPKLLMWKPGYMEKKIVRDSFQSYLPNEILYRPKEAFSDAVSSNEINWAKSIQLHAESVVNSSSSTLPIDATYFKRIFDSIYPLRSNVIPYRWMPRFQKEVVTDPSATVLKCY